MALNFPASPVDGQIYYDSTSGNRYVYDATATKWKYAANNDPYTGVSNTQILFNNQNAIDGNNGLTFSANTLWANTVNVTGYIYGNGAFLTGVASDLTPAFNKANSAYTVSNAAFDVANAAFGLSNTINTFAYGVAANSANAFEKVNSAYTVANASFIQANLTAPIAVSAYTTANAAYNQSNADLTLAAAAFTVANSAYGAANNVAPQVTPAFNTANAAYAVANAAYNNANTKLASTGGTITGDLSIVGTLIVTGNSYQYNSNTMVVSDPLIYLAANNYSSDIIDIGFIANYVNTGGANVHTGLYREHTDKEWYLFQGYDKEPINNHIGALSNNMTLAVLNTDVRTSNLNLGGANAIVWISSSYGTANAAYTASNGVNTYASATYSTLVQWGSSFGVTNAAFGVANAAFTSSNNQAYYAGNNGDKGNATGLGDIFRVHSNTLSQNVTIYSGNNALAAGPITVTGASTTLTIQPGARLAIV